MYKDRTVTGDHIICVGVGDGEVAHFLVAVEVVDLDDGDFTSGAAATHASTGAVAFQALVVVDEETLARLQLRSVNPLLIRGIPERVVQGCLQNRCLAGLAIPDGDISEVLVLVEMQTSNLLSLRLPISGVGSGDLVTQLDILDALGGSVRHQNPGCQIETMATRRVRGRAGVDEEPRPPLLTPLAAALDPAPEPAPDAELPPPDGRFVAPGIRFAADPPSLAAPPRTLPPRPPVTRLRPADRAPSRPPSIIGAGQATPREFLVTRETSTMYPTPADIAPATAPATMRQPTPVAHNAPTPCQETLVDRWPP